jgi:hypothetical protein
MGVGFRYHDSFERVQWEYGADGLGPRESRPEPTPATQFRGVIVSRHRYPQYQ